eukprot:TRINITY_DN16015_c0_g1_i1.p1 TRINITY_DN16015_c0_g1~~TRINITY_DN16015_c0_g1_i1.p1  ORF type:complete len:128 (-),score=23.41 TRINITY_DN16015_c0_g1_i1:61-444(-)
MCIRDSIYISEHQSIRTPLIFLDIGIPQYVYQTADPSLLRANGKITSIVSDGDRALAVSIFDDRANSNMNAWFGLIRTALVCLALTVGAIFLTQDTNELVLIPIEEMLVKVKRIANNPIEALSLIHI